MTRFSFAAARNAVALAAALALSLPCASSVLAQSDPNHVVIPSAPTFPVPRSATVAPPVVSPVPVPLEPAPVPVPEPTSK